MINVCVYKHTIDKYDNNIAEHDYLRDREFETAEEVVEYLHTLAGDESTSIFWTAHIEIEGKGWQ